MKLYYIIYYNVLFMKLFSSHDLDHEFNRLTLIDPSIYCAFLTNPLTKAIASDIFSIYRVNKLKKLLVVFFVRMKDVA